MKRSWAFSLLTALTSVSLVAQEPSPDAGSFEVEPPLLVAPDGKPIVQSETPPASNLDLAQLEKKLERARKSAASAERLWKLGALSKVESEQRVLRVIRLEAELRKAQLLEAQKSVATRNEIVQTKQNQETNRSELTLTEATVAAQTATANLAKAELDAALSNLERQKKLLALGSARKSDVARAEEKLAALKRNQ